MPMPMRYDDGDATPVRQQSHRKSHRNFLLHPPPARKLPALVSALLVYLFSPSRSLQQLFVLRLSRFLLFTCWRQSVRFDWDFESDSASEFVPFRSTATPLRRIQSTSYVYVHFSLLCSLWVGGVYLPGGRGETYSHLLLHFFCWPKSGQSRSKPNRKSFGRLEFWLVSFLLLCPAIIIIFVSLAHSMAPPPPPTPPPATPPTTICLKNPNRFDRFSIFNETNQNKKNKKKLRK